MIFVQDLYKAHGAVQAVAGISFEVPAGQTFGLLGPNGAGKTTTMHLLAGLLRPDRGIIRIAGHDDPTRPAHRRRIALVTQEPGLYGDLTAYENLLFFGRLYGLRGKKLRERAADLLRRAGLTERADTLVRTFSEGMKRRLHLVCAFLHQPQVLLLDEPTVGIDPQSRRHMLDTIAEMTRQGHTILYTTHYIEEVRQLCERVAIMDHGRFLACDRVPALVARHGGEAVVEAVLAAEPPPLPAWEMIREDRRLRIRTRQPFQVVHELHARGVAIESLAVHQPDLEDVFLALTGRRIRD